MKILKRLLSKRNNAGFTLVEVVISIGLLGILLVSMTIFVGPVLQAAADTKKDIRATILAETVDAYISRSVMNANYVAVFTGISALTDANSHTAHDNDMPTVFSSSELKTLYDFMHKDNNSDNYEVRCISIVRGEDYLLDKKWMVYQNKVEDDINDMYKISETIGVFEECFYDGLFPQITVEQATDSSGNPASALKLTIDIYNNKEMTDMSMTGDGFSQLINIEKGKVADQVLFHSPIHNDANTIYDTYIFYISRKTF